MNDPRKDATWKQRRYEDRVLLLLGAILDALTTPVITFDPRPAAPTAPVKPPRTRKQDA